MVIVADPLGATEASGPRSFTNPCYRPPVLHRLARMDVSISLAGDPAFIASFAALYGDLAAEPFVTAGSRHNRAALGELKPELLIVQAKWLLSDPLGGNLARRALYCLAVNLEAEAADSPTAVALLLLAAEALEQGADVCLTLNLEPSRPPALAEAQTRLLYSQIQVGCRHIQRYRDVMQTNDFLSAIALSDSLTELSNRRALEWELPRQVQSARARSTPLSLIVLDVDYFKRVNDSHGHLVGDRVLQLLSARLRDRLRVQDTAFRYGGEEFVILLKQTGHQEGIAIAQRLRRLVGEQPFRVNRDLLLPITVSLGVACLRSDDDSKGTSLLNRADQNLLQAKAGGRNRVVGGEGKA